MRPNPRRTSTSALAGALIAAVGAATLAAANPGTVMEARAGPELRPDPDVEAVVDHRQGVMRATSGHMAAVAAIVLDGAPYEDRLEFHGQALATLLEDIPALFPEGSTHEESGARPEVWEDAATFAERASVTGERAAEFARATEGGNPAEVAQAFGNLGQSCGACHENFRY